MDSLIKSISIKKIIILILLLFQMKLTFAQSKKEQIETFKFRIDSLNMMITVERNSSNQNISSLENQTKILNTDIEYRKLEVKMLRESNSKKDMEIQIKANEIVGLLQIVRELKDSIKIISQIIDTLVWEFPDNITWDQVEFNLKLPLPLSKFNAPKGNLLISKDNKIIISYNYNYTHDTDEYVGKPLFYTKQDAINYYSKDIKDIEITANEGFIIKGKNASNQLIIIKGIYDEFTNMSGRDEGEPNWVYSNTLIIKVTADQNVIDEFNQISRLLINNFSTQSIVYKY